MSLDLENYIKEARSKGMSDNAIRTALLTVGWPRPEIEKALGRNGTAEQPHQPSSPPKGVISGLQRPRKKIILIAIIIVVLVGGGTTFAYFRYFAPQLSPSQVLGKSFVAMQGVKTFVFSANVNSIIHAPSSSLAILGVSTSSGAQFSAAATTSGEMDISDLTDIKQSSTLNFSVVSSGASQALNGEVELTSLGSVYYLKLDNLNVNLGGTTGSAPNPLTSIFQLFENQWFKIDPVAIAQTFLKGQAAQFSAIQSSTALTADKVQKLKDIAAQYQILTVSQVMPDETIGGVGTYHYQLAVDKNNLGDMVAAMYQVISGQSMSVDQLASTTAALDAVDFNDLEIWIGKQDFLVYKLAADVAIQPNPAAGSEEVRFNELASDYDRPVNIAPPAGAKDANQILGGLFGGVSATSSRGM
jgi:hypothetical protein